MAELGPNPRPPDSQDSPLSCSQRSKDHSGEGTVSTHEVVSGVCVLSGAIHRHGPAEMPSIQMPGVMATGSLLPSSSPLGCL